MSFFSEIERAVERGFRRWTEKMFGEAEADDLLLVHRAILADVGSKIQTAQRGKPIFPYSRLKVRLSAADEHRRATYAAAFVQDARLQSDVRDFLTGAGCEVPRSFIVDVEVVDEQESGFQIRYEVSPPAPAKQAPTAARLVVITGTTAEKFYSLTKTRTNIGRLALLLDRDQRPFRSNDVAFEEDGDDVNTTVSRSHAHVRHDPVSGEYRICDDGSQHGTRIFRGGRAIEVPTGSQRGERLMPGDEIYLGRACVRFELDW
ncbi:MAG TPA: FHA domain-containing protein [Terriglobales bacterium]|nr:FHA domain-containing protein [Terriglobales bacterium]